MRTSAHVEARRRFTFMGTVHFRVRLLDRQGITLTLSHRREHTDTRLGPAVICYLDPSRSIRRHTFRTTRALILDQHHWGETVRTRRSPSSSLWTTRSSRLARHHPARSCHLIFLRPRLQLLDRTASIGAIDGSRAMPSCPSLRKAGLYS